MTAADDTRTEIAAIIAAHQRRVTPGGTCLCGTWPKVGRPTDYTDHVAQIIAEYVATKRASAWVVGRDDGYNEALFDERGSHSDSDAHTFPRRNPYRIAP